MIRRILVPLDGSLRAEHVLPRAAAVARAFKARVDLLHVLPEGDDDRVHHLRDPLRSRLLRAERIRYLKRKADSVRAAGIEVWTHVEEGPPAEGIVEFLVRGSYDLVALAPHGAGGNRHLVMGCTAAAVVLNSVTSLLFVPERTDGDARGAPEGATLPVFRKVLAPVDASPRSDWALSVAAILARGQGGGLTMVHVLDRPEIVQRLPGGGEVNEAIQALLAQNRREASRYLLDTSRRLAREDLAIECELVESSKGPAPAIEELASRWDADLVVLSAHGRGAAAEWPFGGIAAKLTLWARRPVLLLQDMPIQRIRPGPVQRSGRMMAPDL